MITKRARLLGEIAAGEKLLREFVELKEKHLQVMRHDLNIIDSTIRMHEIPIDPERIHPIRVQVRGRRFKYGDMSRSILNCLMKFHPDPVATTEVALFLASKLALDPFSAEFPEYGPVQNFV